MANTTSKKTATKASSTASEGFAVIKTGGKQYRVSVGAVVKIESMKGEHKVGDTLVFPEVLLVDTGTDTTVGTPTVAGAQVSAEIVEIGREAKVVVARYKQKSRSGFTKNGHRQPFFKVKISALA